MGNTTVSEILSRANVILQDQNLRWSEAEKIQWVNDAHRVIILMRPDVGMRTSTFTCVAGTLQDLLAQNGLADLSAFTPVRLRSVTRNKGGTGRSIRAEQQRTLDDQVPDWHTAANSTAVQFYIHDPANPTRFYLYPAPAAGHTVEVVYSATPATQLTANSTITLEDAWVPVIVDYVLYRAYSKDAEYTANLERAMAHYKAFSEAIVAATQAQTQLLPMDDGRVTINRTA